MTVIATSAPVAPPPPRTIVAKLRWALADN